MEDQQQADRRRRHVQDFDVRIARGRLHGAAQGEGQGENGAQGHGQDRAERTQVILHDQEGGHGGGRETEDQDQLQRLHLAQPEHG